MTTVLTAPGVYIEELPSGSRAIAGVATSVTAFVGRAPRGPVDSPTLCESWGDYERRFGGLWVHSPMSQAVRHFFLNGGRQALIVRVVDGTVATAEAALATDHDLQAASPGTWGNQLQATVDDTDAPAGSFHLTISEMDGSTVLAQEVFYAVSLDPSASRWLGRVLERSSQLCRLSSAEGAATTPPANGTISLAGGLDGADPSPSELAGIEGDRTGMYALHNADIFNLLCVPVQSWELADDYETVLIPAAISFCEDQRAFFIMDPPSDWDAVDSALDTTIGAPAFTRRSDNAALYYPRIMAADPLQENRQGEFPPCGVVAGIMARTDAQRGVWKAPAGTDAVVRAASELAVKLTDGQQGTLNDYGVNALRTFPVHGSVVWGARTLSGANVLASDWKYVPVRRLALFMEESLYRGTQWAVFEPNDEPLWSQLRLSIGSFMHGLFRQGAFAGQTPREAYFVKCDSETTTQADIDLGIVNVLIGFAPLKPAEFVVLSIQQLTAQAG